MKEIVLSVKGLHCANCASKIERKINQMPEVEEAVLDLLSEKVIVKPRLSLELNSNENEENFFIKNIQKIADSIEDGVSILSKNIKTNINSNVDISSNDESYSSKDNYLHSYSHNDNIYKNSKKHSHTHEHTNSEVKLIIIKLILGGIIFLVAIFSPFSNIIKLMLYLTSYIIIGGDVLKVAVKNLMKKSLFDENFLMSIATIGAFVVGEYPEGVAVMLFYQIGELFQEIAVAKSKKSITSLMDIRPDYANLVINDKVEKVNPQIVKIDDIIEVKVGERVPLDGELIEGNTTFDTSALTGESLPREVKIGEEVLSGFINKSRLVKIKVKKVFEESTVSKILELVQNASSKKSKTEKFITKFARYYTPAVVIIALILAVIPPVVIKGATFSDWGYRALVFLVVSCPCALVISIPLGFFGGIGGASKRGILIKGANYLEALNNVETVVFDKTGTLTKGNFSIAEINVSTENITKEELLRLAAHIEVNSNHPIAQSIVSEYKKTQKINKNGLTNFEEIAGNGIKVDFEGNRLVAGNKNFLNNQNVAINTDEAIGTTVYIAKNNEYIGNIVIRDEIKEDSKKAIQNLYKLNIKNIVMLTGDNSKIAKSIGEELNIKTIFSELLPTGKVEKIEELFEAKSEKRNIVFVGDGINDAPVLARADIGIAMGGVGSDAAIEAADVVIMTDEPSKIATAIKIAKKTKNIVWQNIIFALGVKAVILLMGAGGHATMWEAVFADVGVAIIAILNSIRAMRSVL